MTFFSPQRRLLNKPRLLKFLKHYVRPLFFLKAKINSNPGAYFDALYQEALRGKGQLTDADTIGNHYSPKLARYHYNLLENSILQYAARNPFSSSKTLTILDVGSGCGHWIDFYLELFHPKRITGLELSSTALNLLKKKYQNCQQVSLLGADIADPSLTFPYKFDVINAVGVMFHVVDDLSWEKALSNLASFLKKTGTLIVSGQFGLITQNVQFNHSSRNSSSQTFPSPTKTYLINKRIRSLRLWKRKTQKLGLEIETLIRNQKPNIYLPENNLLILKHR